MEDYSRALERHPSSYRLLRHREHRWITLRELDRAVANVVLVETRATGFASRFFGQLGVFDSNGKLTVDDEATAVLLDEAL